MNEIIDIYIPYPSIVRVCSRLFEFYQCPEEFLADCKEHATGFTMEERARNLWEWTTRELVACEKLAETM